MDIEVCCFCTWTTFPTDWFEMLKDTMWLYHCPDHESGSVYAQYEERVMKKAFELRVESMRSSFADWINHNRDFLLQAAVNQRYPQRSDGRELLKKHREEIGTTDIFLEGIHDSISVSRCWKWDLYKWNSMIFPAIDSLWGPRLEIKITILLMALDSNLFF